MVKEQAYVVYDAQKVLLLKHLLKTGTYPSALIFASTKENVKNLDISLHKMGVKAKAIHSDLEQNERETILREFKNKQLSVLIGTDVLSRGIDVEGISLVVNFDVPPDPEDYIHRIGRTARAETTGTAITFINERDMRRFSSIENLIGKEVPKIPLPEEIGSGPLYQPELKQVKSKSFSPKKKQSRPQRGGNRPPAKH